MNSTVSRKSFLTSLGAAGLGAGLFRYAPPAAAQDDDDDTVSESGDHMGPDGWEAKRVEMYAAFTAALATELGDTTADEVDAAIRTAIMSLIDAEISEDGLTAGKAEALKVIVATTDVPIAPGFIGMGMGMHGGPMGPGGMMPGHRGGHGRRGRGRSRVKVRQEGRGEHWTGDFPAGPRGADAPAAPAETVPTAPEAPATPEAGA